MAETPNPNFALQIELRLLRCTFFSGTIPPPPPPPPPPHPHPTSLRHLAEDLVSSIERGRYAAALSSAAARHVFAFANLWEFEDSVGGAGRFYEEVGRGVEVFLGVDEAWMQALEIGGGGEAEGDGEDDLGCKAVIVMCVGVAAVLAFVQSNMTGPIEDFSPFPLQFPRKQDAVDGGGEWDAWARNELTSSGSDLFGKFPMLQYIPYAKILFSKIRDLFSKRGGSCLAGTKSISWWLFRVILLQQQVLDDLSSSVYDMLNEFTTETLYHFGTTEKVNYYWNTLLWDNEASTIVALAHLEGGVMENIYGRVDSARMHFGLSEHGSGLHLSVKGALGYRTVHQADAKAQMVLVDTDSQGKGGRTLIKCSEVQREDQKSENASSPTSPEYSDILITPKLLENGASDRELDVAQNGEPATGFLTAVQQVVILAQCLHINRSNPDDELSRWKVAPYIEAIDAQRHSHFIIRCFCDILRIRWESSRSRTKERAYMMMDKLVQRVHEASPDVAERIQFCFGVHFPTIPALRKEYGELSISCGLIGEALKIFEDLELWNNIIYCYRLLGKKSAAVDLIRACLAETPHDPKLWCSLGDVTNTDSYFEKALEVSGNRSARAKRSLARSAYNRGDYDESKKLWESALSLNSLYPDGWFALGAAALKAKDLDKALDGFTRAVQLDPDNGEAWNNIACLHMVRKKSKESYIAFREALKFRRNSWQLWQNYSHVAMDIGNFRQALDATKMVLDLSKNKQIDVELLEKLIDEIEKMAGKTRSRNISAHEDIVPAGSCIMGTPESEVLMEMLGNVLQQIVRNGGDNIWGLYARWHKIKGDLSMCSEALLKQVRSYQGADLWHDEGRFKRFAHASLELCNVYMKISSSTGSRRELFAAEMHLKNSIKQAVNFENTEELGQLQACLDDIRSRLEVLSASVSSAA